MTIDQIIASGDRVEFKQYIKDADTPTLLTAWIKAKSSKVQDFAELAYTEIVYRELTTHD